MDSPSTNTNVSVNVGSTSGQNSGSSQSSGGANNLTVEEGLAEHTTLTRARIIHALEVFPFLSSSMLQVALGTSTSVLVWRPMLMVLEAEGVVTKTEIKAQTPMGRNLVYNVYHLTSNIYTFGPSDSATMADEADETSAN